jgi:hypothetical protein
MVKNKLIVELLITIVLTLYTYSTLGATSYSINYSDTLSKHDGTNSLEIIYDNSQQITSYILKRYDLDLRDIQDVTVSYNPLKSQIHAYYSTKGFLEIYTLKNSDLIVERVDTIFRDDRKRTIHLEYLNERDKLLLWETAIGNVFEYDLDDRQINRLDRSIVKDFMFGAGSVYVDSLGIFAFGGYGLWDHKNILLKYEENSREWIRADENGVIPPKSDLNFMWKHPNDSVLYYANNGELSSRLKEKGLIEFDLYEYSIGTAEWKQLNNQLFASSVNMYKKSIRHNKAFSIDIKQGLAHLTDRLFINLNDYSLYKLDKNHYSDLLDLTAFFDTNINKWILVGRKSTIDSRNLWIIPTEISTEMLTPLSEIGPVRYLLTHELQWIFLSILFLVLIILVSHRVWTKSSSKLSYDSIRFQTKDSDLTVFKNDLSVNITDEYIDKIWQIIYRQKQKNRREIMMSDFNDELFTVSKSDSYKSKMNTKLFKAINEGLNSYLIGVDRSSVDKRYKVIQFNLDIIDELNE